MKTPKEFDCVDMRRRIQEDLAREYDASTSREQFARIVQDLSTGDDPVARKWRTLIRRGERAASTPTSRSSD